jgi:hypothetical protein
MSAYWSTSTSSSTTSSTWHSTGTIYYYEKRKVPRAGPDRPLKKSVQSENDLKEERENPVGMPKEAMMFRPEDLVLGGETGWKKL